MDSDPVLVSYDSLNLTLLNAWRPPAPVLSISKAIPIKALNPSLKLDSIKGRAG
jgi:hypothetical protein